VLDSIEASTDPTLTRSTQSSTLPKYNTTHSRCVELGRAFRRRLLGPQKVEARRKALRKEAEVFRPHPWVPRQGVFSPHDPAQSARQQYSGRSRTRKRKRTHIRGVEEGRPCRGAGSNPQQKEAGREALGKEAEVLGAHLRAPLLHVLGAQSAAPEEKSSLEQIVQNIKVKIQNIWVIVQNISDISRNQTPVDFVGQMLYWRHHSRSIHIRTAQLAGSKLTDVLEG
jgi:hypothetical protein